MNRPIWVWCYIVAEVKKDRPNMPPLSAWPQAHTFAFATEEEALEHPKKMGWNKDHGQVLQKVYLQEPNTEIKISKMKQAEAIVY